MTPSLATVRAIIAHATKPKTRASGRPLKPAPPPAAERRERDRQRLHARYWTRAAGRTPAQQQARAEYRELLAQRGVRMGRPAKEGQG